MAGVLFLANGKRAQVGKTRKNQFTRKVRYQTSKISTDNRCWLAGMSQDFWGCIYVLWKYTVTHWLYLPRMRSTCYVYAITGPTWTQPLLVVPRKQKAATGEGEIVAVQDYPTEWEEDEKELPLGPILIIQNCLVTGLAGGKKERAEKQDEYGEKLSNNQRYRFSPFEHVQEQEAQFWFPSAHSPSFGRDPRTTQQKEGYLNATLNASSLLWNLFTVSTMVCIGSAIQDTVNNFYFLGKSQLWCHWIEQQIGHELNSENMVLTKTRRGATWEKVGKQANKTIRH